MRFAAIGYRIAAVAVAAFLGMPSADADVILYNNWQSQAGQQQFPGSSSWIAQSFKTGSSAVILDTVSVMVRNESGSSGSIAVEIYSSSTSNVPSASLFTITPGTSIPAFYDSNSGNDPNGVKESFFHNVNYGLAAETQYFVVVKNLSSANIGIKYPNVTTVTDIAPTPTFHDLISSNSGGSWSNGAPSTGGYGLYITAVPEPSTLALAAMGCGMLGWAASRRRRSPRR